MGLIVRSLDVLGSLLVMYYVTQLQLPPQRQKMSSLVRTTRAGTLRVDERKKRGSQQQGRTVCLVEPSAENSEHCSQQYNGRTAWLIALPLVVSRYMSLSRLRRGLNLFADSSVTGLPTPRTRQPFSTRPEAGAWLLVKAVAWLHGADMAVRQ